MDFSIAILLPSTLEIETVKRVLKKHNWSYPAYAVAREDAVEVARGLIKQGTQLIISNGVTIQYLKQAFNIPFIDLPFSGLDAARAVQKASQISPKIVHIGTRALYTYLSRSLEVLGMNDVKVGFIEALPGIDLDAQASAAKNAGYEVLIGGLNTVAAAIRQGLPGIEFDIDDDLVESVLVSARTIVKGIEAISEASEINKAMLQTAFDGIIALDNDRKITHINNTAMDILENPSQEIYVGKIFETLLSDLNFVDIDKYNNMSKSQAKNFKPLLINESAIIVNEKSKGTLISIKRPSDILELEYQMKADILQKGLVAKHHFSDISGVSPLILQAKEQAKRIAKYDGNVLITGETGTGKELFAQSIHNESGRSKQPFVAVNCATLPANLIESELFGYVKGAFTGANKEGKIGLFETANNGTLFLDEISELPIELQSKLLRAIQEGEIIRVGGDKVITVNTRIICSSNRDLLKLVESGKFKDDLYYRLSVLEIDIPPLRERPEDIVPIANSLLSSLRVKYKKNITKIDDDLIRLFQSMTFPGNVREFENILERLVIMCDGPVINMDTFRMIKVRMSFKDSDQISGDSLKAREMKQIMETLEACGGNRQLAAKKLGIDPSTLYRKLKAYNQ